MSGGDLRSMTGDNPGAATQKPSLALICTPEILKLDPESGRQGILDMLGLNSQHYMNRSWPLITALCLLLTCTIPGFRADASDAATGQAPVIFPGSGIYLNAPSVTITSADGSVYYTTDGSNPARSNTAIAYRNQVPVNQSELLLAAARSSSGWSSVASALFDISGSGPQQTSAANPSVQSSPWELAALYNRKGQAVVSVVYGGVLGGDKRYTVIISDQAAWNVVGAGFITPDNTGVLIGPVEEGHTYRISIKPNNNLTQYSGAFSVQQNALNKEQLFVDQQASDLNESAVAGPVAAPASPAQPVTYAGYHGDGSLIFRGFNSLFKAIDAVSTWENGAYVLESDNGVQVFTTTNSVSTFYLYQSTAYYGSTTSLETANAWIDDFACSHVIYGNGNFYRNSLTSTAQPDYWALEPESGGYFYKYSYPSSIYQTVYETLDFTQATLRESTDAARPYNAYIYLSAQNNNGSAEGGIVCPACSPGNWYLYYKRTDKSLPTITSSLVCGSTQVDGAYMPNANLELVYSYANGSFTIKIINLSTNQVYTSNAIADQGVGGASVLISATSYVPVTRDFTHTPDYQAGGCLENVRYSQCYLSDGHGNTLSFGASGSPIHYALEYNDDYCTYTEDNSSEDVSIRYDGHRP